MSEDKRIAMTVGELLEVLRVIPPDTMVVLARDDEGSDFSPLFDVGLNTSYVAETEGSGQVKLFQLTPEAVEAGADEDEVGGPDAVRCVCLWPVS
jgi:hypothetical protein